MSKKLVKNKPATITLPIGVLNFFPGYIYTINKEDVITFCNDRYARFLGASSSEEVIGTVAITLENSLSGFRSEIKLIIEQDLEFIIQRDHVKTECETVARDDMGNLTTFSCLRYLQYDAEGKVIGMLGVILNQLENEQINRVNLLENIITFIPGSVYWTDKEGVYIGCNQQCANMFGFESKNDVLGKNVFDLGRIINAPKSLIDKLHQEDSYVLSTGESKLHIEAEPFFTTDGKKVIQLNSKAPIKDDDGNVIGLVGNSIDITAQKENEEILRKAKEVAEFLHKSQNNFIMNIQHDIRTPFNGIYQGVTIIKEIVESIEISEELNPIIDAILISVKRILDYCEELIKSGELLVKGITLHEKKFNISHLVQDMVEMQSISTHLNKIEVKYEIDQSTPVAVVGDTFMLKRLLTTVLSNAIKFTKEGSIHLVIKKIKELNPHEAVIRFQIADTGIGISEDDQESIFEMFSKVHPSNTERYKGNGLGLYLAKKMVNEVGGDIELFSKLGEGTTVRFDLPFKLPLDEDCLEQNDPT